MPEFTFYINKIDRDSILDALLDETGLIITPNINHPTQFPESFRAVTPELIRCLELNPRCYISGVFSTRPVQTIKMEKGGYAGTYIVSENKGGPLLILSLATQRIENGSGQLAPSHLTYPKKIWNEQLTNIVAPSEGLRTAFKQVRELVMKTCEKMKEPTPVWIGHSALKSFEAGNVSLLVNGVLVKKK